MYNAPIRNNKLLQEAFEAGRRQSLNEQVEYLKEELPSQGDRPDVTITNPWIVLPEPPDMGVDPLLYPYGKYWPYADPRDGIFRRWFYEYMRKNKTVLV